MKNNKKVIIPLLATVVGLSIVGGVGGAVAWYQYNTRVNASFVGSSVANSGVLQISTNGTSWHRDVYYKDNPNFVQDFAPVTFGSDGDNHVEASEALPNNGAFAYAYPEAGHGSYSEWTKVNPAENATGEYIQYKIYLRALDLNNRPDVTEGDSQTKLGAHDVFLSEIILDGKKNMDTNEHPTYNEEIGKALRIHLDVKGGKKFLISQSGSTVQLGDNLDLDGVDGLDRESKWAWEYPEQEPPLINYGVMGATEDSYSINDIKATKNSAGDFEFADNADKEARRICTTSAAEATEITVTAWLEGWEKLEEKVPYEAAATQPDQAAVEADIAKDEAEKEYFINVGGVYSRPTAYDAEKTYYVKKAASSVWDPRVTGTHIVNSEIQYLSELHVGLTFDVGKSAFRA